MILMTLVIAELVEFISCEHMFDGVVRFRLLTGNRLAVAEAKKPDVQRLLFHSLMLVTFVQDRMYKTTKSNDVDKLSINLHAKSFIYQYQELHCSKKKS